MGAALIKLGDTEVPAAGLKGAGGGLPTEWNGQPIVRVEKPAVDSDSGEFPADGWRLVLGEPGDPSSDAVFAAPAAGRSDRWWLLYLLPDPQGWVGYASWPESAREVGRPNLELGWPDHPVRLSRDDPGAMRVRVRRKDGVPMRASDLERSHVVAFLADRATGELLPHDPWQAFTGPGPAPELDAAGDALLPVSLVTESLGSLPAGPYAVTATLVHLSLRTPLVALELL